MHLLLMIFALTSWENETAGTYHGRLACPACNHESQGAAATISKEGRDKASSSSEVKLREASAAFSELGGAELPRATFRPSLGTMGGF